MISSFVMLIFYIYALGGIVDSLEFHKERVWAVKNRMRQQNTYFWTWPFVSAAYFIVELYEWARDAFKDFQNNRTKE